jgi:rhodanese-related sulfurtransferase
MKKLFFLLIIATSIISGCSSNNVQNLSPKEFNKIISNEEVYLIDVHVPEQDHILGTNAVIPYNEIQENLDQLPEDKDAIIAIYCRSGSMSRESSETLKQLGYKNIYNLEGGRNAYVSAGFN